MSFKHANRLWHETIKSLGGGVAAAPDVMTE